MGYPRAVRRLTGSAPGPQGIPGRGVVDAKIDPTTKHLVQTMSDGTTIDAGVCQGGQGDPGPEGPMGPGLDAANPISVSNGSIVFKLTDGRTYAFAVADVMQLNGGSGQ